MKANAANQFAALLQTDRKPTRHPSPLASDVFLRALGILYGAAALDLKRRRTSANPRRSTQCLARGRAKNHPQFAVPRATPLNSRAQRAHGLGVVRPKTLQCRTIKNDVAAINWGARQPRTPIYLRRPAMPQLVQGHLRRVKITNRGVTTSVADHFAATPPGKSTGDDSSSRATAQSRINVSFRPGSSRPSRTPALAVFLRALGILHAAADLGLKRGRTPATPCNSTRCLAHGCAENHPQFRLPRVAPLNSRAQRTH